MPATWHPQLAAEEGPPGVWRLIDGMGVPYATIEIRRVQHGAEVRYRVTYGGAVLGWATSLRLACERAHQAYLRAHGPSGGPIADWGTSRR
ncbi:hypothetical protein [Microbacterium sp. NPDC077184]|uniref:hypothetical protein n=1 Tax=Microbacterium sp. NPDC077184 TaxID=3154764 RepID=UPI00343E78EA